MTVQQGCATKIVMGKANVPLEFASAMLDIVASHAMKSLVPHPIVLGMGCAIKRKVNACALGHGMAKNATRKLAQTNAVVTEYVTANWLPASVIRGFWRQTAQGKNAQRCAITREIVTQKLENASAI